MVIFIVFVVLFGIGYCLRRVFGKPCQEMIGNWQQSANPECKINSDQINCDSVSINININNNKTSYQST